MAAHKNLTLKERLFGRVESSPDDEAPSGGVAKRTLGPASPPTARFVEDELYEDDIEADIPTLAPRASRATTEMTQEQLRARRMAKIEQARVGRPFHEVVMLIGLK